MGMGIPIPDLSNLPGVSRPGKPGSGGGFEYTTIDNGFSMKFDGSSSYLQVAESTDVINDFSNPWSISWWAKWDYTPGFDCFYQFGSTSSPVRYIIAWLNSTGIGWSVGNSSAVGINYNIATGLNDGNWHHIVFTGNGNTSGSGVINVYVDGVLNTDTPISTGATASSSVMNNIGRGFGTTGRFFNGQIDELSIFNVALSAGTIQAIYNATANNSGKVADLTETPEGLPSAWYRMGD